MLQNLTLLLYCLLLIIDEKKHSHLRCGHELNLLLTNMLDKQMLQG
jgi:hypothetical protein